MNDNREQPITLNTNEEWSFKHLNNVRMLGIDIGGSLVKIAYSSSFDVKTAKLSEDESKVYSVNECKKNIPTLNFIKFETKHIDSALDYMEKKLTFSKEFNEGKIIKATGGGAVKYKDLISQKLGVSVEKEDELDCLVNGFNFLLRHVPNEVFSIDYKKLEYEYKVIEHESIFPYILVNIGSGVSILKVESDDKFERIGGSTIGGATLWGLGSLLTDASGFDEILELAEKGDNKPVDMLVKDIYGGSYDLVGLGDDLIASSFGKTTRSSSEKCTREEHLSKFKQEDLAKSLLLMICYDVSQIASLQARIHNINKVYFGGSFIRNCAITMQFLRHGISYWSQDKIECLFLRHEGYLGAIGAFLKCSTVKDQGKYSWFENLAHSTISEPLRPRKDSSSKYEVFELNREECRLVVCPLLLNPNSYIPDLIDLTKDEEARHYWLGCFEKTINTYEKQCIKSYSYSEKSITKANEFKVSYISKLMELRSSPFAYGMLTVRVLLDLREHLMAKFDFFDVYSYEKREENRLGLELLDDRCNFIESIQNIDQKYYELFRGFLAGNVYDYGAQAFIQKQEKGDLENFNQAINTIDDRLFEQPGYIELLENLKNNVYKNIYIFVDNSGFDIILGVLPFVVELLKTNKTKVILCVNSKAAINDITYSELVILIKKACLTNKIINQAYNENKNLIIFETGSASPCLDLSRLNLELANLMSSSESNLVILEGMGRSIHTNYNAKFKCDCLKIAVIKNQWLANRFGFTNNNENDTLSNKFPVIFKFEKYLNTLN